MVARTFCGVFSALRWCFGLHGYTLAVEEAQRHQSCLMTDQTLWERNVNLCCDKADLLFHSRGIAPAGGEKRREGELRMMGKGKKIALIEVRRGAEIWAERKGWACETWTLRGRRPGGDVGELTREKGKWNRLEAMAVGGVWLGGRWSFIILVSAPWAGVDLLPTTQWRTPPWLSASIFSLAASPGGRWGGGDLYSRKHGASIHVLQLGFYRAGWGREEQRRDLLLNLPQFRECGQLKEHVYGSRNHFSILESRTSNWTKR